MSKDFDIIRETMKEEMTNKYYNKDLCVDAGRCKLYHPLFTQGECYYYNEWCELKDKVYDLEAKLAEKEELLEESEECKEFNAEMWTRFADKCKDLTKQLAEKEKERHEEWKTGKEWKWEWQKVNRQLEQADQDKISFAVEQLEKVKELLFEKAIEITGTSVDSVRLYSINEIFSNQIKQLNEMK